MNFGWLAKILGVHSKAAESKAQKYNIEETNGIRPGWAITLQSPFDAAAPATSWIGGQPTAPSDFVWPRDNNGQPLLFVSQIDLATLSASNASLSQAYGLTDRGAILTFIGNYGEAPVAITLTEDDMLSAVTIKTPEDIASLENFGFLGPLHTRQNGLAYWPIEFIEFDHFAGGVPNSLTLATDAKLEDWITTNAMALFEAKKLHDVLTKTYELPTEFPNENNQPNAEEAKNAARRSKPLQALRSLAPTFLQQLAAYIDDLSSQPEDALTDQTKLADIAIMRRALAERLIGPDGVAFSPLHEQLVGSRFDSWSNLVEKYKCLLSYETTTSLPAGFQSFAAAEITRWRGHYLFGPSHIGDIGEIWSQRNLITITGDSILGSEREHEAGFAICLPKKGGLAAHQNRTLLMDWHTNV